MREEITFKTVDDILEHYGWGGDTKKRGDKKDDNAKNDLPGAGEDRKAERNAE